VVERSGNVVVRRSWPRVLLQAPFAAAGGDVWLASTDGYVARLSLEKGGVVEKHLGAQLKCAPLADGVFGLGGTVSRLDGPVAIVTPASDDVVALVRDGQGSIFVGYRKGVLHLRADKATSDATQMKSVGFSNVAEGEIVKNGLAITAGKLIVTTTRGIQVFE
ncbi:MAG: hypothetical protein NTW87_35310, partial [Planctomycetota bacterium]|nr:hypothetical protein [Planctomycetota bacterium]